MYHLPYRLPHFWKEECTMKENDIPSPILVGSYSGKSMRAYFQANSWATAAVETDEKVYPAVYVLKSDKREGWPLRQPQRIAYSVGENTWEVSDIPMTATITKLKTKGSLR